MREYTIVEAKSTFDLVEEVDKLLNSNWQPIGSVFIYTEQGVYRVPTFCQAMIREEE